MRKLTITGIALLLVLQCGAWGSKGHRIISRNMTFCLPPSMSFLQPAWTQFVADHASDADYRKSQDPDESPRHYIDIDNYQVFIQTGRIPQTYDSVLSQFGSTFVIDQGILPWATLTTFDSLKNCFQRHDWNRSAYFAADLGHYVGDGHQPMHITANYDGQLTGQSGVHSRYETQMIGRYESSIAYPADQAQFIGDVRQYVFNYLYADYEYVDSVLTADMGALLQAGNNTSNAYYTALWERAGGFTNNLMRGGSASLADLIYTAWVMAGSPVFYPNGIDDGLAGGLLTLDITPNPVASSVQFQVGLEGSRGPMTLTISDMTGKIIARPWEGTPVQSRTEISWDAASCAPGVYLCRLTSGAGSLVKKLVVTR